LKNLDFLNKFCPHDLKEAVSVDAINIIGAKRSKNKKKSVL